MKDTDSALHPLDGFERRHQSSAQEETMLRTIGASSMEALVQETVPAHIFHNSIENMLDPLSETALHKHLESLSQLNKISKQYIGLGYAETLTPAVILRNVLENPAWYTAYTPYQAEIAQGRLEALFYFQTMVTDLTGLPLAGASLLDEATAAAEAMTLCYRIRSKARAQAKKLVVIGNVYPQTVAVLEGRVQQLGLELEHLQSNPSPEHILSDNCFAILVQYPDAEGAICDFRALFAAAKEQNIARIVCADLLSLTHLQPPGEWDADVVVGSTQRFGVPLGYGGPHAAYMATRTEYQRQMPGRIIGLSRDRLGTPAYRMALQTREQHIRREKATSNICTAQVLLAIMAAFYAIYHGPLGLAHIADRIHRYAVGLALGLEKLGLSIAHPHFFDTLKLNLPPKLISSLKTKAEAAGYNLRYYKNEAAIGITLGETTQKSDIDALLQLFAQLTDQSASPLLEQRARRFPSALLRSSSYLTHPIFSSHQTEHGLLRLMRRMEEQDFSLVHGMIPLGSCTMKLNATSQMQPLSWPAFSSIHPFAPDDQTVGYRALMKDFSAWLCQLTGFSGISFQPNSGAQGEYAGLCVIKAYHQAQGQPQRNLILIPSSAHGTNPASAHLAGLNVEVIPCDKGGNIDKEALQKVATAKHDILAGLMVTYPSTHGVFEEDILSICEIVHEKGGQVYMDGANMNAQIGVTSPFRIGADLCHLNLHKTFCIPHGGGGPGMGPIAVAAHLVPYLPQHPLHYDPNASGISPIAAAPYGSASLLLISYAYIALMGGKGLRRATDRAILHANYLKNRLEKVGYDTLHVGKQGRVAHEMIIDCRSFQKTGITVEDIAKRLMDYGFHAPTISFPVPGTMMIEPTESETFEELERFCDALEGIRKEIAAIADGHRDTTDNLLKNAPHPIAMLLQDEWPHPYTRQEAAYPHPQLRARKLWPARSRIDNTKGDRHLQCSCPPIASYASVDEKMPVTHEKSEGK